MTYDASTQPGDAGRPLIALDGSLVALAYAAAAGLEITGGGSVVRGLAVQNFGGAAIRLAGKGGNLVEGNYLGTKPRLPHGDRGTTLRTTDRITGTER